MLPSRRVPPLFVPSFVTCSCFHPQRHHVTPGLRPTQRSSLRSRSYLTRSVTLLALPFPTQSASGRRETRRVWRRRRRAPRLPPPQRWPSGHCPRYSIFHFFHFHFVPRPTLLSSAELGTFLHAVEDEMLCLTTMKEKVPYFNAPIYLQNKTSIGKVDEILGPINQVYFSIKMDQGMVASSFKNGEKVYIAADKLLPLERFLPKPKLPRTHCSFCDIRFNMLISISLTDGESMTHSFNYTEYQVLTSFCRRTWSWICERRIRCAWARSGRPCARRINLREGSRCLKRRRCVCSR